MSQKRNMVLTVAVISTLVLFLSSGLFADDGSWNKSFSIHGGSIYSEEENRDVALEKELLVFDGESTTAIFLFRNVSKRDLRISCAFPVMITLDTIFENGYLKIPIGRYGNHESITGLEYFETEKIVEDNEYDEMAFYYPEKIPINDANNSREFLPPSVRPESVSFSIEQNGEPVEINQILLERHADRRGAEVTFHYKHDLVFPAGKTTILRVEYSYNLQSGDYGGGLGPSYNWDYIISTGRTWRGPIGEFYLAKPADWGGDLDELPYVYQGRTMDILFKEDYEPGKSTRFTLSNDIDPVFEYFQDFERLVENCFELGKKLPPMQGPLQEYLSNIGASSALGQRVDVFTRLGVVPKMGFGPESAFDGLPHSAWCEDAPGDGIGEYISWNLHEPVWGLSIQNGYNRILFPDAFFSSDAFQSEYEDRSRGLRDYYALNNRVKTLEISTAAGEVLYTLDLRDSREVQAFPGVLLQPGSYRAVIREVYEGTAWEDTCLGEITFLDPGFFASHNTRLFESDFLMEHLGEFRF